MNKLTDWIKRHQIAAFSIITFVITWRLGFSYGVIMKQGQFLLAPVMFVATCGPMLAGTIITANTNTGHAVFSNMDSLILIVGLAVAALVLLLVDQMWQKLPPTTRRCTSRLH